MTETYLALEVTDQKIRYIVIDKKIKGMAFKRAGGSMAVVDPSVPGAFADAIKAIIAEHKLKVSRLFLSINRKQTVIHQLSLGKMSRPDLESIIEAEIERIPSFTDKGFDYIYQEPGEQKVKNRVIFAAVDERFLQYLLKEVRKTGIPCRAIDIVPLNIPGILTAPEYKEGAQALVVLLDTISYLVLYDHGQLKFLYTTSVGKDLLFPAFKIFEMDKATVMSWAEELKRAIKSYALDSQNKPVSKTWLVWDQENAKDFDQYLREEANFPLQPLGALDQWLHERINPIYVLAATPAIHHAQKIKANFSLDHFFRTPQQHMGARRTIVAAAVFLIVTGVVFAGALGHFAKAKRNASADAQAAKAKISLLEKESTEVLKLRQEYETARDQMLMQATYVKILKRMSWSEALSVVASELPEELSLTAFKVNESGLATFTGEAFAMKSVSDLLRKIETSSILEQGKFNYLNQQEVEGKTLFKFGILANFKMGEGS